MPFGAEFDTHRSWVPPFFDGDEYFSFCFFRLFRRLCEGRVLRNLPAISVLVLALICPSEAVSVCGLAKEGHGFGRVCVLWQVV